MNAATTPTDKRLATIRAQLALRGYELVSMTSGPKFIVRRWALSKSLETLDDVIEFAERATGVKL